MRMNFSINTKTRRIRLENTNNILKIERFYQNNGTATIHK